MRHAISLLAPSIVLCILASASPDSDKVSISFENMGSSPLGVFFVGNETRKRLVNPETITPEELPLADLEMLSDVLNQGEFSIHHTHFHHAFELRTADFQFRAKVAIYNNFHTGASAHLPYIIMFKNLMAETVGSSGRYIELKHSSSGFLWIHPSEEAAHASDPNHFYELRNNDRESVVIMRILPGHPGNEL